MNHISIDQADERVKTFLQSLPIDADGTMLELAGEPLLQVFPAHTDNDHLRRSLIERGRELVRRARARNLHISPEKIERDVLDAVSAVRERNAV